MWLPIGGDVRGSDHEHEHPSALSASDDEHDRSSSSSDHDESSSLGGRSAGSSEELENDLRMEGISSGPVVRRSRRPHRVSLAAKMKQP